MPTKWLIRANFAPLAAAIAAATALRSPPLHAEPPAHFDPHRPPRRSARSGLPHHTKRYPRLSRAQRQLVKAARRRNRS
jgi:hypothetical protein